MYMWLYGGVIQLIDMYLYIYNTPLYKYRYLAFLIFHKAVREPALQRRGGEGRYRQVMTNPKVSSVVMCCSKLTGEFCWDLVVDLVAR